MPEEPQDKRQDCQQGRQSCKEHADLGRLTRRGHIGRQTSEDVLKFVGTGSRIIFATGQVGDLGQGLLVDFSPETASATEVATATKEIVAKTQPSTKEVPISTVHWRTIVGSAEPDRIHSHA